MDGQRTLSRWLKPMLVGVCLVALIPVLLVFGRFVSHDRPTPIDGYGKRGMMWQGKYDSALGSPGRAYPMTITEEVQRQASADDSLAYPAPGVPMMGGVMTAPTPATSIAVAPEERKIASTASLDLRVNNLQEVIGQIREAASAQGGYVEHSSVSEPRIGVQSAWMTVKVPANNFQAAFDAIKSRVSYVAGENMGSTDLTTSFIDLQARLNNKQAEERIAQGLFDRATKISDAIEVSQHLATVRAEIESLQGQLRLMENQTAMATISISLTEDPKVVADGGEFRSGNVWKRAWNELVASLTTLGSGLVVLVVAGIPVLFVYGFILWGVYALTRKGVRKFFE